MDHLVSLVFSATEKSSNKSHGLVCTTTQSLLPVPGSRDNLNGPMKRPQHTFLEERTRVAPYIHFPCGSATLHRVEEQEKERKQWDVSGSTGLTHLTSQVDLLSSSLWEEGCLMDTHLILMAKV